jgi:DNA-nicking Smr family endonuclease
VEVKPLPPADDGDLFFLAMSGVKRLGEKDRERLTEGAPRKLPSTVVVDEDDQGLFHATMRELQVVHGKGEEERHPSAAASRLRRLKRGEVRIDYELDLHGLTRDEALDNLERFITGAHRRKQEAVLVITGKGYHSAGEPVLQGAVAGWLRDRAKGKVVEFFPAPRQLGGDGAMVVFLRPQTEEQGGE